MTAEPIHAIAHFALANAIRTGRLATGMTTIDLATAADIHIDRVTVLETDPSAGIVPSAAELDRILRALDVPPGEADFVRVLMGYVPAVFRRGGPGWILPILARIDHALSAPARLPSERTAPPTSEEVEQLALAHHRIAQQNTAVAVFRAEIELLREALVNLSTHIDPPDRPDGGGYCWCHSTVRCTSDGHTLDCRAARHALDPTF